jgi:CheY-like chemotaxis protein
LASDKTTSPASRRALLAETDPATLRLCRETLTGAGFDVEQVETGLAAVVAVRDRRPDLVFVASQLRDSTGYEAIEWMRANPEMREVPIILLTSDADRHVASTATEPSSRLRKPLSAAAVRRTVAELFK